MMDMRMCSESVVELAKAMVEVQKKLRPALKDRENEFTRSRYATLNSVMEACGKALLDAGIWVTQYPVPVEGEGSNLGLVTKLVHAESGEWQASLLVMPLPKNDPQGYGSALTYARRYGLSSMIGLVTEDDDANAACISPQATHLNAQNQGFYDEKVPPFNGNNPANSSQNDNLPRIDGVSFKQVKASDGSLYITATGNVRNKNGILKEAGFKWNSSRKIWWKAA
jgi:hypothetical protein